MDHEFNFAAARIIAHAGNRTGRERIEAWASDDNSDNRCVGWHPHTSPSAGISARLTLICPICNEVMSQRRRWVLEVHLRENHPGISAESVLGPSPLSQRNVKRSATTGAKTPGP
ncbi:unnamed protein product, partial [Dibothriocephalus latus]